MIFFATLFLIYAVLVLTCCFKFLRYNVVKTTDYTREVSVLVAAKNEEKNIVKFLKCLENQTYTNFKIILIDDNSTDSTFSLAENYGLKNLILKKNPNSGKKSALKFGSQFLSGEYVILTDADCFMNENWLETIVSISVANNFDMILSPVVICAENVKSLFQRLWQAESCSFITITAGSCIASKPVMCNGGNIGYKTDFFKENLSGFNQKFFSGDDMFMLERAKKMHKKIGYVKNPNALVETFGPETFKSLFNQRSRWVSKTSGYRDFFTLFFAFIVFSANIGVIVLLVFSALKIISPIFFVLMFLLKFFADFLSVKLPKDFFKIRVKFFDIIVLALFYPYYVLFTVVTSLLKGFKWK